MYDECVFVCLQGSKESLSPTCWSRKPAAWRVACASSSVCTQTRAARMPGRRSRDDCSSMPQTHPLPGSHSSFTCLIWGSSGSRQCSYIMHRDAFVSDRHFSSRGFHWHWMILWFRCKFVSLIMSHKNPTEINSLDQFKTSIYCKTGFMQEMIFPLRRNPHSSPIEVNQLI